MKLQTVYFPEVMVNNQDAPFGSGRQTPEGAQELGELLVEGRYESDAWNLVGVSEICTTYYNKETDSILTVKPDFFITQRIKKCK